MNSNLIELIKKEIRLSYEPDKKVIYLQFINGRGNRWSEFQIFFSVIKYYDFHYYPFGHIGREPERFLINTIKLNCNVTYSLKKGKVGEFRDLKRARSYVKNWIKHSYDNQDTLLYLDRVIRRSANIENVFTRAKTLKELQ